MELQPSLPRIYAIDDAYFLANCGTLQDRCNVVHKLRRANDESLRKTGKPLVKELKRAVWREYHKPENHLSRAEIAYSLAKKFRGDSRAKYLRDAFYHLQRSECSFKKLRIYMGSWLREEVSPEEGTGFDK